MATYLRYKASQNAIIQSKTQEEYTEAVRLMKHEEMKWQKSMEDSLLSLYEELLQDAFRHLPMGEEVVVVPTRSLGVLPIHAAFYEDSGRKHYLIEDYEISFIPNCTILDLCYEQEEEGRHRDSLFAVANPLPPYDLEYSEWEVEEIGKFFPEKEVHSKQEAREVLLSGEGRWGVLHLATHGFYDLSAPLRSRLSMGEDVSLTLEDIVKGVIRSGSWMVCLSACESGLSDYRDVADEQIGFQTAFLYSGIPTVIGSLWTVDDFTTALMMIKMYEGIFRDGKSKAQALRNAQLWLKDLTAREALEIIRGHSKELERACRMLPERLTLLSTEISAEHPDSQPFSHPYYWAGFQLFGV
jgi:CHAT domain-containing protein